MLSNADVKVSYHPGTILSLRHFKEGAQKMVISQLLRILGSNIRNHKIWGEFDRPIEMPCGQFNKSK